MMKKIMKVCVLIVKNLHFLRIKMNSILHFCPKCQSALIKFDMPTDQDKTIPAVGCSNNSCGFYKSMDMYVEYLDDC